MFISGGTQARQACCSWPAIASCAFAYNISSMKQPGSQRVVFQPGSHRTFQRGINQIVDVVRPTLGPCPRIVASEQVLRFNMPELLDNAGVIARRIIALPDR